jgi:hypothetical protein
MTPRTGSVQHQSSHDGTAHLTREFCVAALEANRDAAITLHAVDRFVGQYGQRALQYFERFHVGSMAHPYRTISR